MKSQGRRIQPPPFTLDLRIAVNSDIPLRISPEQTHELSKVLCSHGWFEITLGDTAIAVLRDLYSSAYAFFRKSDQCKSIFGSSGLHSSGYSVRGRDGYVARPPGADLVISKQIYDYYPQDDAQARPVEFYEKLRRAHEVFEEIEVKVGEAVCAALDELFDVDVPFDLLQKGRGRHRGLLRVNHYQGDSQVLDGEHVDWTPFTLISADHPALEILMDGIWSPVNQDGTTLTVILGEQIEYWTGGILRGVKHRVLREYFERERISVVFFCTEAFDPSDHTKISPIFSPGKTSISIAEYLGARMGRLAPR